MVRGTSDRSTGYRQLMAKPDDESGQVDPQPGEERSAHDNESIGMETGEEAERALGAPEALIGELPED